MRGSLEFRDTSVVVNCEDAVVVVLSKKTAGEKLKHFLQDSYDRSEAMLSTLGPEQADCWWDAEVVKLLDTIITKES